VARPEKAQVEAAQTRPALRVLCWAELQNATVDTGQGGFSARVLAGVGGDINPPVSED
jgi:hypothetical protein